MASERAPGRKTWFYQLARRLLVVFSALVYPCKLLNPEGFSLDAPYILMSNHQSMMDPLLLAVKLKKYEIRFIGKRELTSSKTLKWIVEHLHMISVSRHASDLAAMRAAGEALRQGHVLGIFPEGGRRHGVPMETMESGVSLLALRHRVPLLPVYIISRPRPFRRTRMFVAPPLDYSDLAAGTADKAVTDALSQRIKALYLDLQNKYKSDTIAI